EPDTIEHGDAAAQAQAAAEQGLTLPQIALEIATEVAATRHASLATTLGRHNADATAAGQEQLVRRLPSRLPLIADAAGMPAAAPQETDATAKALHSMLAQAQPSATNTAKAGQAPATLQPTLLSSSKAASIAGAKRAVLTMQARLQDNDGQPRQA